MAYSKIIDDILDKVFVKIFGDSLNSQPPWFKWNKSEIPLALDGGMNDVRV